MAFEEVIVDTRELESPEPMQRVIDSLHKINDKTYLKMIHRMEPRMLFGILKKNGFEFIVDFKDSSLVGVYIFKEGDNKIKEHIKGIL